MKTRTIIQIKDGKPVHASKFEVAKHIILRNMWEYYIEEPDQNGVAFGYVMGDFNEWGCVDLNEIKPYILSECAGSDLDEIMAPDGYAWEDEAMKVFDAVN